MVALAWVPDPFSAKHPPTVLHSSRSHVQSLLSIAWEAGTTIPQIWFSIEGSEPKNVTLPRLWLHVWVTVHSGLLMIGLQFLTHLYSIIHMLESPSRVHTQVFQLASLVRSVAARAARHIKVISSPRDTSWSLVWDPMCHLASSTRTKLRIKPSVATTFLVIFSAWKCVTEAAPRIAMTACSI